jgi:hypothetical protein
MMTMMMTMMMMIMMTVPHPYGGVEVAGAVE